MLRTEFHFDLPTELIAQFPTEKRSDSRLLHFHRQNKSLSHHIFHELPYLLQSNDLLIFNNTRVIPARLFGHKESGGKIEILVERLINMESLLAHVKASHAPKAGSKILLDDVNAFEVVKREDDLFILKYVGNRSLKECLTQFGHMPLPPYIKRQDVKSDQERYQTIFAREEGAVAAPTAGLHFDNEIMQKITEKGIQHHFVTLHVGAGTFQPVRVDNILEHKMHHEFIEISAELCDQIKKTKANGGRVVAVGTTVVRCLESAADENGNIQPFAGNTNIFIYPGYKFKMIDALITNFHLPESTLLMLVSAFAGKSETLAAYQTAVEQKYRFFSYGDAMLIE